MGLIEELVHCLTEVPQSLLLHDDAARCQPVECRSRFGQLAALLGKAWRAAAPSAPPRLLLACQVPYESGVRAVHPQCRLLNGSWLQPVSRHKSNLSATTDIWCSDIRMCVLLRNIKTVRPSAACGGPRRRCAGASR